jgi:signal transduction histidine kinase/ActR/RegA family two-component response regulator
MTDPEITRLRGRVRELEDQVARTVDLEQTLRERERELNDSLQHATRGMLAMGQFAREEAERANRFRDEFLAVLSHELRTPLNAILGWTQIVNGRAVDEATMRHAFAVIERNAALQMRHIDDLLDVSHVITGKLTIAMEPVDFGDVVAKAIATIESAAATKELRLDVDIDRTLGHVTGDAGRLQQMVWHLLINAVKFTPKYGDIRVTLSRAGEDACLRVCDSGEGISPDFLPHVFEPFRQADRSSTRSHRGIGLGLAVVRHLTEAHGGTITVSSDGDGCGATFTVTLPLHVVAARPPDTPAQEAATRLDGVQVLVVDDNADARDVLFYLLNDSGAIVEAAGSAKAALEIVASRNVDVVIADLSMPDMDGYGLIDALQTIAGASGRRPYAIAVTACAGDFHRRRAIGAGYDAYLAKPVAPADLAACLQAARATQASAGGHAAAV